MTDIVDRLRREVALEGDIQSLCRAAADEIVRLREELDSCVRTMNICIADYQKLRQVALDGDTLVAYRLGVKHAMDGEPESTFRERVAAGDTSPTHVAESPEERHDPLAWVAVSDGSHNTDMATARLSAANTWLQEEIKRLRLADAERDAVKLAAEWFASVPLGDTLRSLLERTK